MISNVKEEVVDKRKWISDEELIDLIAVGESTPGPIAINMATYIGYKRNKFWGSVFATLGVVLPSFLIILGITYLFNQFISNQWVAYAFLGVKVAVSILILRAGIKLLRQIKLKSWQYVLFLLGLAAATCISLFSLNFSTVFLVIIGAFLGLFINALIKSRSKEKKK